MMSTTEQQLAIPDDLDSSQTKLVYLAILVAGSATVSELQERLGLSKLTLMPVLASLTANDLVVRTEDGYACR